jgi:hypothetical protein
MAKRTPKETSLPVVIALVFFVLTTIAFGVMWYMQFSDQQAKDEAVKKANQEKVAASGEAADALLKLRILRIYLGVAEEKDAETIASETKGKEKVAAELKKINDAMAKSFGAEDVSKLPPELLIWPTAEGAPGEPPTKGIISIISDAVNKRNVAIEQTKKAVADYTSTVAELGKQKDLLAKQTKNYEVLAAGIPGAIDAKVKENGKKFDDRAAIFTQKQAEANTENAELSAAKDKAERNGKQLAKKVDELKVNLDNIIKEKLKKLDTFQYDEPQGKILRRLPDDLVEINIGSASLVRPGLTFTVLPNDFPEKGRQSRMRIVRTPNERGEYKSVERFIEKGTIEVIEVLGPNSSRARITGEYDKIRDGIAVGDLLYNSVWRKGTTDHIALIGLFDINGDGSDDIEHVIRDLTKMGIPVDAYFDLRKRQWVGQITEQTRYIVEGYYPLNTANDPNREEKTKLLGAIDAGIKAAQAKGGAQTVSFRDFFPRMGYRVKIDINADKINQATAPYVSRVNTVDTPPAP